METKKGHKKQSNESNEEVAVVKKSNRSLYVIIFLLIFGLGLCFGYTLSNETRRAFANNPYTNKNNDEFRTDYNLLKDGSKELICIEDDIPSFNINSADATNANNAIKSFLNQESEVASYTYNTYQYKNVITILTITYYDGGMHIYNPYVLDSKTGKLLSNEEMLKAINSDLTSETLVDSLIEAYKGTKDATELEEQYKENYNKNLSDLYSANLSTYKMFINSNGEVIVITELIPSAGPSTNSFVFNINKKTTEKMNTQA